jgi:RNA polymerase sigma-70 factor (ECF subfamily)
VFRGLPSLQIPEAFRAWVYRIAHHKAARFIRIERRREENAPAAAEIVREQDLSQTEAMLNAEALHQGMQFLPTEDRELLVLHYLRDLSTPELAIVLGCPPGTIKSRLYHSRLALRRIIERKKL